MVYGSQGFPHESKNIDFPWFSIPTKAPAPESKGDSEWRQQAQAMSNGREATLMCLFGGFQSHGTPKSSKSVHFIPF